MKNNLSPHVQIYKFPITAISSITNRITGLILTGYFVGGGISCFTDAKLKNLYYQLNPISKKLVDYSILFPLNYHTLGGIRHYIWDKYPDYLNNKATKKSSYILFGASIGLTFISERVLDINSLIDKLDI